MRRILLSLLSGILAGLAADVFLVLLQLATHIRETHAVLIWGLPLAGFGIGLYFYYFGQEVGRGNNLILDEIHDPQNTVPFRMAPFILIGTLVTHLFGGSAGREGTAVQMGASLSDQLSRLFHLSREERKLLLMAGAGAGFGAAIGTPLAGAIFGMEVIRHGRLQFFAWTECLIAAFVGYGITRLLHAPHTHYPHLIVTNWSLKTWAVIALSGVAFGLAARLFVLTTHAIEWFHKRYISYPPFRPFLGGLVLVGIFFGADALRYAGLGLPIILQAFNLPSEIYDPFSKLVLTAITLGSGFKGGEFIPLVFIGTTLGSAIGGLLNVSFPVLAAVGFASVFGAAAKTPWACAIMAVELFGIQVAPYVFLGCFISYWASGNHGIYKGQKR